jgi:SPP1 gp7 family putative phage head morphogenesis protein
MTLTLKHIDHDRKKVRQTRSAIQTVVGAFLQHVKSAAVTAARSDPRFVERDRKPTNAEDAVTQADWRKLMDELRPHLGDLSQDGARVALEQVAADADDFDSLLDQANKDAIQWADKRAGELVGMKKNAAGDWVENQNRKWAINDTTRDMVRKLVTEAEAEGWTGAELAEALEESAAFDEARAEMVSRTESAFADTQGNVIGWQASGVVAGKQWSVNPNEDPCEECLAMDGVIVPIDEEFDEGDPPLHPRCECVLLPVVSDDGEDGET